MIDEVIVEKEGTERRTESMRMIGFEGSKALFQRNSPLRAVARHTVGEGGNGAVQFCRADIVGFGCPRSTGGTSEDGGNLRRRSERGADGFIIRIGNKRGGEDGEGKNLFFHEVSPLADTHPSVADFHLISGDFKDAFQIAFGGSL